MIPSDSFDAYYYTHCCGNPYVRNDMWLGVFGRIADRIVTDIAPRRVLDAGCAYGFLVEMLRARDVDAFGIDISEYAIGQVYDPVKPFCRVGSITEDLSGPWDLVVSIEVAEHMETRDAERAIANICAGTSDVLFSSSPVDHREPTHVNVHPPEYWAGQFARHGFYRDVDYDATFILPWAARFRKRQEPFHRLVLDYERRYWALLSAATDARSYSADVQKSLAAVEAERDSAIADRDAVRAERDTALAQLADMHTHHDNAIADRDAVRAERDTALAQLADMHTHHDNAIADRDAVRAERDTALTQLADMHTHHDNAIADRDAVRAELGRVAVERDELRKDIGDLRLHLEAASSRVRQLTDTITHMERSVFWKARMLLARLRQKD